MVDFGRKLKEQRVEKKVNPIEIYNDLDRSTEAGPLRPTQVKILTEWFKDKLSVKDVVVKLHTGEGKTLIGLLMLNSRINSDGEPCLYVCPNKHLVRQVAKEADKFGIPYCLTERDLPDEFLSGKKLLITNIYKLFNGRSVFKLDNQSLSINTIVLDDAHACIESIKDAFTMKITRDIPLYACLLSMFEDDLKAQGEGSFIDISSGKSIEEVMHIPYWAIINKRSELTELLSMNSEEDALRFKWPIIRNNISECQIFVTATGIEICPYKMPVDRFGSFARAEQRILMSATTQDDSFFIKGFGFDIPAVKTPLSDGSQKWSGEKMILIPSLIDDDLRRENVIPALIDRNVDHVGTVSIVPGFRYFDDYAYHGVRLSGSNEAIEENIELLKSKDFSHPVVFANRYDGIDLPDASCRILILDSKPFSHNLSDRYEEQCRTDSDIINIKTTQKIEQGLGRSVRGEKDYSVIVIIGTDLVKFIKSSTTNKYFTPQTRKQIDIGLDIAQLAVEEIRKGKSPEDSLLDLIHQSLNRDENWKAFYRESMDSLQEDTYNIFVYEILQKENLAEELHLKGNNEKACDIIQEIIDHNEFDKAEKGWYQQIKARYMYNEGKLESLTAQLIAFQLNNQLLKPTQGVIYKKIGHINESRNNRIRQYIQQFNCYEDLILSIDDTLNNLSFGGSSEKFEQALYNIGKLLGFESQRPDKEIKKGPDNLWGGVERQYFIFECKTGVDDGRTVIHKREAGQMSNHCGWFDEEYKGESKVKRIMIIPTKTLAHDANFNCEVEVMRKNSLNKLKRNILGFVKEFKPYVLKDLGDEVIQRALSTHDLQVPNLCSDYTEKYKKVEK